MKAETKAKVTADLATGFLKDLSQEIHGFQLQKTMKETSDILELYRYTLPAAQKGASLYYHEETHEYKLRVQIGLTQFCQIDCIAATPEKFAALLQAHLQDVLTSLVSFDLDKVSGIVRDKGIATWEYGKKLPTSLEGFSLFIRPEEPQKITNGSYIILDYSDFLLQSNFAIYYNIFRDEFFGEAKIHGVPSITYQFDANTLEELEFKLDNHLATFLHDIRQQAEQK